jgi:hypothetical protein
MTTENSIYEYAKATQAQLQNICGSVPVYANFNRNYATEPKWVAWQIRNVHQPVYTGSTQSVKGIDRPVIMMNVFASEFADALNIADTIKTALNGYSGLYGGSTGFYISKADVAILYNSYDNTIGLHQVVMDCTLDIPA